MLQEKLGARRLPDLLTLNDGRAVRTPEDWRARRTELLELLSREEYGYTPAPPERVTGEIDPMSRREASLHAFGDKAVHQRVRLSFDTPGGAFSFPLTLLVPKAVPRAPVFIYIDFERDCPDRLGPVEEILDHGFALAAFCYRDVSDDGAAFDGLGALYPRDERDGWGKLGMWAFAASRVLDYLETRDDIDARRACVCGHSRLGKAALWCGAQDERFSLTIANDSGCSGAAISRGKTGERIDDIARHFPYWFCGNYQAWRKREDEAPFDQHMLLALCAPRRVYVSSAEKDSWADPESEFLGCLAADPAWRALGADGFVSPDAMPELNAPLMDGHIGYHVRPGSHFYSRTDWGFHIACREKYDL